MSCAYLLMERIKYNEPDMDRNVRNKIFLSDCQRAMGQMRFTAELDMWFIVSLVLHLKEEIKTTLAYDSIFDH